MSEYVYFFSKLVWFFLSPDRLFLILLIIGGGLLFTRWQKSGRRLIAVITLVYVIIAVFPVADLLINPLEERFPMPELTNIPPNGIIVLGGAENTEETLIRGQVVLQDTAERLTAFIYLARYYPTARLIVSDSSSSLTHSDLNGAVTARQLFSDLGLDVSRVEFEEKSRNTYENAVFTMKQVQPASSERWLLVTSAFHMPRAIASFRKQGWNPIAYPVDYRGNKGRVHLKFDPAGSLVKLSLVIKEYVGLFAYWAMGRSSELFPESGVISTTVE